MVKNKNDGDSKTFRKYEHFLELKTLLSQTQKFSEQASLLERRNQEGKEGGKACRH